jgi:hypothetical protein
LRSGLQAGEAISHTRLDDLPKVVRSYVKNLHAQYQEMLRRDFGLTTIHDMDKAFADKKPTPYQKKQQRLLIDLLMRMRQANKEQAIPKRDRARWETVERLFDLSRQYETQLNLLKKANVFETALDGTNFVTGIDNKTYPIPTLEDITARILESKDFFETKADQKFVKLLLVPFGMSLDQLIARFRLYLLEYKQTHPTFGRTAPDVPDESDEPNWDPLWVWEEYTNSDKNGSLVYDPKSFDQSHNQGKTKAQILERGGAWSILTIQSAHDGKGFRNIPRQGKGRTEGTPPNVRPDIEASKTPKEYLTSTPEGEHGMTPEEWFFLFIAHLEETGKPIDDWQNGSDSIAFLTGAYFKVSGDVLGSGWNAGARRARLGGDHPGGRVGYLGCRRSVRV